MRLTTHTIKMDEAGELTLYPFDGGFKIIAVSNAFGRDSLNKELYLNQTDVPLFVEVFGDQTEAMPMRAGEGFEAKQNQDGFRKVIIRWQATAGHKAMIVEYNPLNASFGV